MNNYPYSLMTFQDLIFQLKYFLTCSTLLSNPISTTLLALPNSFTILSFVVVIHLIIRCLTPSPLIIVLKFNSQLKELEFINSVCLLQLFALAEIIIINPS